MRRLRPHLALFASAAAVGIFLAAPEEAHAEACDFVVLNPSDGEETSTTPTIRFKPNFSNNCEADGWSVVINPPRGDTVYSDSHHPDVGLLTGRVRTSEPIEHSVPSGKLEHGQDYSLVIAIYDDPGNNPFRTTRDIKSTTISFSTESAPGEAGGPSASESNSEEARSRRQQQDENEVDLTSSLDASRCLVRGQESGRGDIVVRVTNRGAADLSGNATLKIFLSKDRSLDQSDTELVTARTFVSDIASGGSSEARLRGEVPSSIEAGTYYLISAVDQSDSIPEGDENNNLAFAEVTVSDDCLPDPLPGDDASDIVGGPPSQAELERRDITEATTPQLPGPSGQEDEDVDLVPRIEASACLARGDSLDQNVRVWIRNAGTAALSGDASIELYFSSDSSLDASDTEVPGGRNYVDQIPAGTEVDADVAGQVPSSLAAGNYQLIVAVDQGDDVSESDEGNNTASARVRLADSCDEDEGGIGDILEAAGEAAAEEAAEQLGDDE